jgi:hypothetical protein
VALVTAQLTGWVGFELKGLKASFTRRAASGEGMLMVTYYADLFISQEVDVGLPCVILTRSCMRHALDGRCIWAVYLLFLAPYYMDGILSKNLKLLENSTPKFKPENNLIQNLSPNFL